MRLADSAQRVFSIPENLYQDADRILLRRSDARGRLRAHVVSRNFYWVPTTLTTFDWPKTDYTHTPAARHEDLTALTNLPPAKVAARAEIETTPNGREFRLHLDNSSAVLAFQIQRRGPHTLRRTHRPRLLVRQLDRVDCRESRARSPQLLPETAPADPIVQIEGWNIAPETIKPTAAVAPQK